MLTRELKDIASLIIQGVGGGLAAAATDLDGANMATVIILFSLLSIEYFVRYHYDAPFSSRNGIDDLTLSGQRRERLAPKLKIMTCALSFSTLVLFIRAIYRTIELADGWNGRIISNETYFNVLDGAMVVLAMYTMNFINPGVFLPLSAYHTEKQTEN
ncbi:hypothetical protein CVT26_010620 [Gymnopilus dilepis]|uniref:Uncharacterized protein n=1 Tax=Gymnopilus dilepis TaxID=231916 RepID=A0A409W518_9AGAR|nr:hypothetical protein CVT26_010620 [Gymnopilus dilepis]